MVFADKESASEVMRIIDQHDTDEAMKRIISIRDSKFRDLIFISINA
jgi:hypothetical protein